MLPVRRIVVAVLLLAAAAPPVWADALERLKLEKLRATHEKVEALAKELRPVGLESGYEDVRTLLHVHSAFSHDSRGTIDEIIDAAHKTGVRVIMFSEHPASHYDYVTDGHHGLRDGVLLIPGAETQGFHAYPQQSLAGKSFDGPQQFADTVKGADGLIFLCHLEERMDWEIKGLTGSEIYNTHADVKDEPRFMLALRSPLALLSLASAVKQFPQETFASIQDYPADYLRRFDELCAVVPHTGVSANDAHHNQGFHARLADDGKVELTDALDKKLAVLDPEKVVLLKPLVAGKEPGESIFELDLDPYERSFRHVSTHLLLPEVTEAAVREALVAGRAYVAFDWMADPTGFVFRIDRDEQNWPMGAGVPRAAGLRLRAEAPLAGTFKLVRDGQVIAEESARSIDVPADKPGVYRVEVWLTLAGEARPWILSNPIYIRPD